MWGSEWCLLHSAAKSATSSCTGMQAKGQHYVYAVVAPVRANYIEDSLASMLSSSVIEM